MNRSALFCAAAALLAGLGHAPLVQAQWKWRDAGGVIQYSDRPPPQGTADKDILQRPAPPRVALAAPVAAPAASDAAAAGAPAASAPRRNAEKPTAEVEDEKTARARADNCQRARNQLRALEDGVRMARINDKGEREVLDDKARADEARRARDVVNADCRR